MDYRELKRTSVLKGMGDFDDYGGWSLDTQFVDVMGVPYLLAHGLGKPVADAKTKIAFPVPGLYHVKVYTYNWVAPWKQGEAPGKFRISIGDQMLEAVFGTEGSSWGWQDGGSILVKETEMELSLHDLTGFEGRCGLLFFTREESVQLPTEPGEVREFYRLMSGKETVCEDQEYELIVCGGGIAGMCTALSAARRGVRTALIQDRLVVGGNNSSEVRVWLGGETNFAPYEGIGNIVNELEQERTGHYGSSNIGEIYEDDRKLSLLESESFLSLYMGHILTGASMDGEQIQSVEVYDIRRNSYKVIRGKLFTDATGDGTLAYASGAHYEVTTNGHQGMTNMWYVEDTGVPQEFPECPWAIDLHQVAFPGREGVKDVYGHEGETSLGCWFWESGNESDPILMAEYARDTNFRAMYGAWNCLKNYDKDYENYRLGYASYIAGKRESRRVFGDVILTKCEVETGTKYEDGCVPSTWNFDVHYPDKRFYGAFHEGDGFLTKDYHEPFERPFFIPYRCLYSRNIQNLFMAGRNVSVSHDALGTVRVMRTGGMMGEVLGIAASLCVKHEALPRDIYAEHLDEMLEIIRNIPEKKIRGLSNVHPD